MVFLFFQSHKTSEARIRLTGRKAGAIAALCSPEVASTDSCSCSDPFPNESKELVPTFRKLLYVAFFPTSGARVHFGVSKHNILYPEMASANSSKFERFITHDQHCKYSAPQTHTCSLTLPSA